METGISMAEQKGLLETRAKGNCSGLHLLQGCNQELEGQKGSSCNRFIFFFFFLCLKTMQLDGYWLYWTKTQLFFPDGWSNGTHYCLDHRFGASLVFCPSSSAGLHETLLLHRRIEESNIKSGTAIRLENDSYFWSLY